MKIRVTNILFVLALVACETSENLDDPKPVSIYEKGEEILGGRASTRDKGIRSFEHETSGLTNEQKLAFFTGNAFFRSININHLSSLALNEIKKFFKKKKNSLKKKKKKKKKLITSM